MNADFKQNPDQYMRFKDRMTRPDDGANYGCAITVYKRPFYAASYTIVAAFMLFCLIVGYCVGA